MIDWKLVGLWLPVVLWYLFSLCPVALGVIGLTMKNTGRLAMVLIKTLSALALVWGFWEMFSTTATLVRGLSRT